MRTVLISACLLAASCERKPAATGEPSVPVGQAARASEPASDKPPGEPAADQAKPAAMTAQAAGEVAHPSWSKAGTQWANLMVNVMPEQFCKSGMYFSSCFKITADECRQLADSMARRCLENHPDYVPTEVNPTTGQAGGQKLGTCAGTDFEIALKKQGKFTDTPRCNDVDYWMRAAANAK